MSALHKAMVYLGFSADRHEEYDYTEDDLAPVTQLHEVSAVHAGSSGRRSSGEHGERGHNPGGHSASDLRRIQTVKPSTYNDARVIGEAFRQGVPVIMNLTEMPEDEAKRLVDFAAGLSFGLQGSLERVTTSVFLLSPAHVEIGLDTPAVAPDPGFYNHG